MALLDQEKTEAPTPRRRDEARKEGRIPRSAELTTSFVLLGAALLLNVAGPSLGSQVLQLFRSGLSTAGSTALDIDGSVNLVRSLGLRTLVVLGTWGAALMAIAIAVAGPQARGIVSAKPLAPDASRLSPATNIKRVLGPQGLVELIKSVAKLLLIAWVVRGALGAALPDMMSLAQSSAFGFLLVMKKYVVRLLVTSGLAYLALAAFDYVWQVWRFEQSLRMSRDEIKQEVKQSEGDPLTRQRLRSFGRALARRQMFRSVPSADVVITNPTHVAVALIYDPDRAPAPIVVAKGQRKVAERIKAIAREHGIPCIENKPLARALLATAHIGSVIPAELYVAVAEILAFVIRRRVMRGARLHEVVA
ncbi:MAG: Flagellar biosynthetic protein FlhB [Gemmatimonadaceae bacterium]|nr:Flagellar biosynthetic protein FlhB [Gemmatimonadaceae bacterium]